MNSGPLFGLCNSSRMFLLVVIEARDPGSMGLLPPAAINSEIQA